MPSQLFAHIGLNCKDIDATERFYAKHFGMRRVRVIPLGEDKIVFLRTENGDLTFEMFRNPGDLPKTENDGPQGIGAIRHLAFQVDSVDAKLKAMGGEARISLGPMDFDDFIPGWRTVWVLDPDNRVIEISQGFVDQKNPPPLD